MGSVTEVQEGTLETVDAPMGTPIPAAVVSSPHGGEDTESTKEVGEEAGQPPKREFPESSVPSRRIQCLPSKLKEDRSVGETPRGLAKAGRKDDFERLSNQLDNTWSLGKVAIDLQNLVRPELASRTSSKYWLRGRSSKDE